MTKTGPHGRKAVMDTLVIDRPAVASGQTVTVGAADSGRMLSLRVGDRLTIQAPAGPGVTWRLRGATPVLTTTPPRADESGFALVASQPGRAGVDLVASGTAPLLPRPIRLIVCVG